MRETEYPRICYFVLIAMRAVAFREYLAVAPSSK